jgi:hypothetical protein
VIKNKERWAVGVTTVLERRHTYLPKTLNSLCNAGFDQPTLFIDGCSHAEAVGVEDQFKCPVVTRNRPNFRCFGNWFLAAHELVIRTPYAHRYLIVQDDFVTYHRLREYLNRCSYPKENSYYNLYTVPENQELIPVDSNGKPLEGWHKSNQKGRGAVALMFTNEGMATLLAHPHMISRPKDTHRGFEAVDGSIVHAMKKAGYTEYVHYPSLVQHIGDLTTLRSTPRPKPESFMGEDFDVVKLLTPPDKRGPTSYNPMFALGDKIGKALEIVGVTSERVEKWLGRPCNCEERKAKLNRLGAWVERILIGKTQNAEQYLNHIMGQD